VDLADFSTPMVAGERNPLVSGAAATLAGTSERRGGGEIAGWEELPAGASVYTCVNLWKPIVTTKRLITGCDAEIGATTAKISMAIFLRMPQRCRAERYPHPQRKNEFRFDMAEASCIAFFGVDLTAIPLHSKALTG